MTLSKDYDIYLVKRNNSKEVRLAQFSSLLKCYGTKHSDDRVEVHLVSKTPLENFSHELWQKNSLIWFAPGKNQIFEATRDNKRAEEEYQIAVRLASELPDVDPTAKGSGGTLILVETDEPMDGVFRHYIRP